MTEATLSLNIPKTDLRAAYDVIAENAFEPTKALEALLDLGWAPAQLAAQAGATLAEKNLSR